MNNRWCTNCAPCCVCGEDSAGLAVYVESLARTLAEVEADRDRHKAEYLRACEMIATMHAAAVGEVRGPIRGVVEDVADLRADRDHWRDCCAPLTGGEMIQIAMGATIAADAEIVDLKDEIACLKRQVEEADSWATDHGNAQTAKIESLETAIESLETALRETLDAWAWHIAGRQCDLDRARIVELGVLTS